MSSVVVDFDVYPREIMSGQTIRCFNKCVPSGIGKNYFLMTVDENIAFTINAPTSNQFLIASANTKFEANQLVTLKSSGTFPTGFAGPPSRYYIKDVTATYVTLSAAAGGTAINYTGSGSGTFSMSHAYLSVDGSLLKPAPVSGMATYNVSGYYIDAGYGASTLTKTGLLTIHDTGAASYKPTSPLYGKVTVFIYDSTDATAINRRKKTGNPFFFQKLRLTGCIDRAGTAKFTVCDMGAATATDKGLIAADKNVAIIVGRSLVWSGKILRAVQGKMSLYDTAVPFSSWNVECESDISKMKKQAVLTTNMGAYTAPAGYIVQKLVEPAVATDIDWRGVVEPSVISHVGPHVTYSISNSDMYSQLVTLASISGFDWRTRLNHMKLFYPASGYSAAAKTVTVSCITPYTTDSFVGKWLLFINDTNADGTSNTDGVRAYGKVTSNTTTVITMTAINNSDIPPASSSGIIILGDPVLDFVFDFRQQDVQATFTSNKARSSSLHNAYEMNDKSDFKNVVNLAIAKGKSSFAPSISADWIGLGLGQGSYTIPAYAKDDWDNMTQFFKNSTFITQKTSGWIYSYAKNATTVVLIGQGYAIQNGDVVSFYAYRNTDAPLGTTGVKGTVNAVPTTQVQADGTPTTTLSFASGLDTSGWARYGSFVCHKIYVDTISRVYASGTVMLNLGFFDSASVTSSGIDALYGPYLVADTTTTMGAVLPHVPGTIVSTQTYTPTSPQSASSLALFGTMAKTLVSDQNVDPAVLEQYCSMYLWNSSSYLKKGAFWCIFYDWYKSGFRSSCQWIDVDWIREGDLIGVLQNTADTITDVQYAQYKNQWQVVEWTLDAETMKVSCELGDIEMNPNTLVNSKTSGLNTTLT